MKNCKETLLGGRKLISLWLCALALAACTDTLDEAAVPKPLSVAVNARDITARAPIHGTALPDASNIGISLVAEDGTPYDGVTYDNLKYTAAGTAPDQTWSTPNIPTLSSTPAKLVAYYPWAENTDYSAVPVETDTQTDYMYSQWLTGLSNANPNANIVMQHALTAVRVALVKGDFTADVDVSSVSVKSPAFATAGSLDATTGALSGLTGIGDAVTVTADFPLTAQATNVEVMAVPDVNVSSGVTTVTTQIGDRKYSVNINFTENYKQGYIYTYTLTLNNTGMEVTSVAVTPWEEGTADNGDLAVDNDYIVKIAVPSDGYTFTHNLYDFTGTIDWGDGTVEDVTSVTTWPTHTYQTAGEYTVTAKGVATSLSNYDKNTYSVNEDCFTELVYIGQEMGLINMKDAFYYSNLNKIHEGALDGCTKVTSFEYTFAGCTGITSIPDGLFDKCPEVTTFNSTFYECSGVTEIPQGLFDNNAKVISFGSGCGRGVFGKCTGITSIPEGLFDKCTNVTSFEAAFYGTSITKIPEGLFDKCPLVTSFGETFGRCTGLTSIPAGLFDNCTEVTTFYETFYGCAELISIPAGLFDNNTKVTSFSFTFSDCTALTEIPERLFDNCPEMTTFCSTFQNCTALESIPAGLFDNNTKVTNFIGTFATCTALTGIPTGLFDNCTEVTIFSNCFENCTGLTDIPEGLFDKCTDAGSFTKTFYNCTSLTSIPAGLFDYNTKVTSLYGTFFGCTALIGESPYTTIKVDGSDVKVHLYERASYPEYFTTPTGYNKCFNGCAGLTDYANIPAAWK